MAAPWRPGQQGYQYPMQTGYSGNPQLQQNPQFQPQHPQFQPQNPQFQLQQHYPAGLNTGYIPYGAGAVPQLPQQQQSVFPSMAQQNPQQQFAPTQQLSWALSKDEKKKYNDIFRSWDPQNTSFIDGPTALSVFRDTGLPQNDLARIWYISLIA
jgi:hypothetical protein